jgi:DNA-directed RNA polymerase subunit alpha
VLACKKLNLNIEEQDEDYTLVLKGNQQGELLAGDIECPSGVEVMNKDLKIVTLTENAEFIMELVVSKGIGYKLAPENRGKEKKAGVIYVDSIYNPVINFQYEVADTRVGDKTNYDNLKIDITTNGSLKPEEAIAFASEIVKEHFTKLEVVATEATIFEEKVEVEEEEEVVVEEATESIQDLPIEEVGLENKYLNKLKSADINTVGELMDKSREEIKTIPSLGDKGISVIYSELQKFLFMKVSGKDIEEVNRLLGN